MKPAPHEPRSLQSRLALLFGMLLVVLTALLLIFLNVTSRIVLLDESAAIAEPPPQATQAGVQATPTPIAMNAEGSNEDALAPALLLPERALQQLGLLSLLGFVVIIGAGGIASYWLAGRALQPLRAVSHHAHQVSAGTLDQRIEIADSTEELSELTSSFNRMLERLEEGFERERRFVSDAAHELQSPLAALRLNLEVASSDPNATVASYQDMTQSLERSVDQLEQLVAALLLLTTGKTARSFSTVLIMPLVEQAILKTVPVAEQRGIVIKLLGHSERAVEGNRILLERVIANLVENAVHYSQVDSVIEVLIEESDSKVVIAVVDSGIGILPMEQERIFERFYRTEAARQQRPQGSGLGLPLVKHIVELHGGSIHVESTLNTGSVFVVTLPTTPLLAQARS